MRAILRRVKPDKFVYVLATKTKLRDWNIGDIAWYQENIFAGDRMLRVWLPVQIAEKPGQGFFVWKVYRPIHGDFQPENSFAAKVYLEEQRQIKYKTTRVRMASDLLHYQAHVNQLVSKDLRNGVVYDHTGKRIGQRRRGSWYPEPGFRLDS